MFEFAALGPCCGARPEFVSVITGDGRQILVRLFAVRMSRMILNVLQARLAKSRQVQTLFPKTKRGKR